jgi:hypothetical protein
MIAEQSEFFASTLDKTCTKIAVSRVLQRSFAGTKTIKVIRSNSPFWPRIGNPIRLGCAYIRQWVASDVCGGKA